MKKRSAMTIAGGLVAALLAGAVALSLGFANGETTSAAGTQEQQPRVRTIERTIKVHRKNHRTLAPIVRTIPVPAAAPAPAPAPAPSGGHDRPGNHEGDHQVESDDQPGGTQVEGDQPTGDQVESDDDEGDDEVEGDDDQGEGEDHESDDDGGEDDGGDDNGGFDD